MFLLFLLQKLIFANVVLGKNLGVSPQHEAVQFGDFKNLNDIKKCHLSTL